MFHSTKPQKKIMKRWENHILMTSKIPLKSMHNFTKCSHRFMNSYMFRLNGRQAAWAARVYKGHWVVFMNIMEELRKMGIFSSVYITLNLFHMTNLISHLTSAFVRCSFQQMFGVWSITEISGMQDWIFPEKFRKVIGDYHCSREFNQCTVHLFGNQGVLGGHQHWVIWSHIIGIEYD